MIGKLARTVVSHNGAYKWEWWQYDGFYVLKEFESRPGGGWSVVDWRKKPGKAPREVRSKPPAVIQRELVTDVEIRKATNAEIKRRKMGCGYISAPDGALVDGPIGTRGER